MTLAEFMFFLDLCNVTSSGGSASINTAYAGQAAGPVDVGHPTVIDAINTLYPIYSSTNFAPVTSVNFISEIFSINSRVTPVFRYTGTKQQVFGVVWDAFVKSTVGTQQNIFLRLCVYKADTTLIVTDYFAPAVLTNTVDIVAACVTGQVELETGDRVFMQIENTTSTANIFLYSYTATIASILAGIAYSSAGGSVNSVNDVLPGVGGDVELTTDNIPQGDANLYVSTDGGETDILGSMPTIEALNTGLDDKMAKDANLSDVADRVIAQGNLGLMGQPIAITASVTLANPLPARINTAMVLEDQFIKLPAMNQVNSIAYSQSPVIICQADSKAVIVKNAADGVVLTVQPGNAIKLVLKDATENGVFETLGEVYTVNEKTYFPVLKASDIDSDYEPAGYVKTSDDIDGHLEGISDRLETFDNNVAGVTIASESGSTGANVLASHASQNGNIGTLTGTIEFTATNTTPTVVIVPPFGASFNAPRQASGAASVNKSSGAAIGDGEVPIVNSVSGLGIQFSMLVAVGSGLYTLNFSVQYTIDNS